ncbi:HAD family hydrolase [Colwelliaceae bacterium 6471]
MNNKYNAVLFDLDGTLLDTANDLGEALNYVLTKHNQPIIAREKYRPVASDGAKGLLELGFGEQLKNFSYEQLRQEFLDYYQENIAVHTCLYPGVEPLLTRLNEQNIPWGIVTNKPENLTYQLMPHFQIFEHSQAIVGGDTIKQRKPHPAPLIHACQLMNIDAKQCLYIGDAPRDIEAGNSANMYSIVALWGYILDQQSCLSWQANALAKTPEDICTFIF